MWFTSQHAERDVSEEFTEHQQQEQEQDHRHDDDIMTDAHADVKPAAVVADQEEEVLSHQNMVQRVKYAIMQYNNNNNNQFSIW